ncbi:cytochrome c maturation protein CcmE [Pseudaquabacterium rugosum]|uniref:Cytochrome c-type biogenesis protein CcmE n=1 Tax=Pseudaquabacterium rugosum TaxID=2984194 RepID=A0ABU9BEZ5_9BURK
MKPRHRRLAWLVGSVLLVGAITALVLDAFRSNLVFFYTPTQVMQQQVPQGRSFRLGGLVEDGSLRRQGLDVQFRIHDGVQAVPVVYRGALPDLFKEGKGAVAQGRWQAGRFEARELLAKHDENYMPPEAAAALHTPAGPAPRPTALTTPTGAAR